MPGRYIATGLYSEVVVNRGSTVFFNFFFFFLIHLKIIFFFIFSGLTFL